MRCPLCQSRSARRACPGVRQDICPVCCGSKRLTEINCPETCVYLTNARAHPAATVRRQQDRDLAAILPALRVLSEPQQRLFMLCLTLVDRFRGEGLDTLQDSDVAAASAALASTYETAAKGVIYEHPAESRLAGRLAGDMRTVFDEAGRDRPSALAIDAAAALRQIEHRVREVAAASPASPRTFIELSGRMSRQFRQDGGEPARAAAPAAAPSSLLIP